MSNKAPEVKIKGTRSKTSEKKQKAKHSNWLLTVSTNQRYKPDDPHKDSDAEIFEEAVQAITKDLSKYIKIEGEGHSWSTQWVDNVDVSYAVEYGPKSKALHAHLYVKTTHRTKLKLDYEAIKNSFKEYLGLDNVYLNAKLIRTTSDDFLNDYLDKFY